MLQKYLLIVKETLLFLNSFFVLIVGQLSKNWAEDEW